MWKRTLKFSIPLIICLVLLLMLMPGCKEEAPTATVTTTATATTTATTTATATTTTTATVAPTTPTATKAPKDKILIGASRPLSGAWSSIGNAALKPIMEMWGEEVNADGGIYVKEYGKKLPVEFKIYDDTSDLGTMVRLTEKLIVEDKVDILFPACGTSMISAQAPIANKYGKVLITAEGGATIMKDALPGMPYVFISLSFSDWYELPVLADMLAAKGAKTAYIIYIADLHGVEYSGIAGIEFDRVGIQVLDSVSVPIFQEDFEPIIKAAKAANPDVFCAFCYPWLVFPAVAESMTQGFNPDAWIGGPGANFGYFKTQYFGDGVEGVLCFAVANQKTSPEMKELFDNLIARVGEDNTDYWGWPLYAPLVSIWQQAIEETGTLDQKMIRDYIATHHFNTILGDTWFDIIGGGGGLMAKETHPGEIGQWQSGIVEIVGGGDWDATKLTADFIYPKPTWPAP
jgi:branched-chain amino acid transport system substrate-binding protein